MERLITTGFLYPPEQEKSPFEEEIHKLIQREDVTTLMIGASISVCYPDLGNNQEQIEAKVVEYLNKLDPDKSFEHRIGTSISDEGIRSDESETALDA